MTEFLVHPRLRARAIMFLAAVVLAGCPPSKLEDEDDAGTDPRGACCVDGACSLLDPAKASCAGTFLGAGSTCEEAPCTRGACCSSTGCAATIDAECMGGGFVAMASCEPDPCTAPVPCCLMDDSCVMEGRSSCRARLGIVREGAGCDPDPCARRPVVTPCCIPNGECTVATAEQCEQQGGVFPGDAVDCSDPELCSPFIPCCEERDLSCTMRLIDDCRTDDNQFAGMGASCSVVDVCGEVTENGACCEPNGTCVLSDVCSEHGTYQGDGTDCESIECPTGGGALVFQTGVFDMEPVDGCMETDGVVALVNIENSLIVRGFEGNPDIALFVDPGLGLASASDVMFGEMTTYNLTLQTPEGPIFFSIVNTLDFGDQCSWNLMPR